MTIRLQFVTLSWLSLSRLSTAFVPSGSLNKQQLVKHASCESLEDFDKLRNSFEHLLDQHADSISDHPLFLTSASRRRRQLELDLLRSLEDSDDAVDELMHMWMYEGTPEEAEMLVAMEGECSSGLFKEEAMLKNMIQSHPTWCEPCLRLATLLYFKGRTEDSYAFAHRAMELKVSEIVHAVVTYVCILTRETPESVRTIFSQTTLSLSL
jgi:hypothetical protein